MIKKKTNIRQATKKDASCILKILNYEILNSTAIYDYNPRTLDQLLEWLAKKEQDNMPVIVAEQENKVLGYGTYGIYRPWDGYKYSVEHSVYVDKDIRGENIGTSLMETLIILAKENGFHTMIAGIDASNESSYRFHEKFGFTEVGRFKEVGYKFNKWLDLVFMQLFLNKK